MFAPPSPRSFPRHKEVPVSLFLDEHEGKGLTAESVARLHRRDVELQERWGVAFREYWFEPATGAFFCLVEAPTREAVEAVHRAAHGSLPRRIVEVRDGLPTWAATAVPAPGSAQATE
jgi:hypothetical protein